MILQLEAAVGPNPEKGKRIRGGTARGYYVGIETAGLAVPAWEFDLWGRVRAGKAAAEAAKATYTDALSLIETVQGWVGEIRAYGDEITSWHAKNLKEAETLHLSLKDITATLRVKEKELITLSEHSKAEIA